MNRVLSILPIRRNKLSITKREKFAVAVFFLSVALFIAEYVLGKSAVSIVFIVSILADIFMFWALREDLKENVAPSVFVLPFFFTLAFGLFYLLVPARILTKIVITTLYALGIYSIFLSQNIFTVSSIRTIALLSGARTVSFVMTLITYFFLANVVFSLHLNLFVTLFLICLFSLPLIFQSLWTYTLEKNIYAGLYWAALLTMSIVEVALMLWFWPSTPTILALFITGFVYIVLGLSHVWLEKRLFRGVIWEYLWVAIVVFTVLVVFTSWT